MAQGLGFHLGAPTSWRGGEVVFGVVRAAFGWRWASEASLEPGVGAGVGGRDSRPAFRDIVVLYPDFLSS